MSSEVSIVQRLASWFKQFARPALVEVEKARVVLEDFDQQLEALGAREKTRDQRWPVCLLGHAGVGKSTLINTLIADSEIVVPSGGGSGPLTANALRVTYGETKSFEVKYHNEQRLNQARFVLEEELRRSGVVVADDAQQPPPEGLEDLESATEEQRKSQTSDAVGQASLIVTGEQNSGRDPRYLVDGLRWALEQSPVFGSDLMPEDIRRLRAVKEALASARRGQAIIFNDDGDRSFQKHLREHAAGSLAPLIETMTIRWPSDVLKQSVDLVDLPGIGVLRDSYEQVTKKYLGAEAEGVMLVVGPRGLDREDAELLRSSGFLKRLLHAGGDFNADPVSLVVVAVKVDDVALENHRYDSQDNGGKALATRAEHFQTVAEHTCEHIRRDLDRYLRDVWKSDVDGGLTAGKQEAIDYILQNLKVFAVSAPQYRLYHDDDGDRPWLDKDRTQIPLLRKSIVEIARRCVDEQARRRAEGQSRFLEQVAAKLSLHAARLADTDDAVTQSAAVREEIAAFIATKRREYDTRRGQFRAYLKQTMPEKIRSKVSAAADTARKEIEAYLENHIGQAHWKTLQATVNRGGSYNGKRVIKLHQDLALRFEEPVAEVWSRTLLSDVRKETRDFANYQVQVIEEVVRWAKTRNIRVPTKLIEALAKDIDAHRRGVDTVGKEAIEELKSAVNARLSKRIEGPIRRKCNKFVLDRQNEGPGIKRRIEDLFKGLAEETVQSASEPTIDLLVELFQDVEKQIVHQFKTHEDPIQEAEEILVQRVARLEDGEAALRRRLKQRVDQASEAAPALN